MKVVYTPVNSKYNAMRLYLLVQKCSGAEYILQVHVPKVTYVWCTSSIHPCIATAALLCTETK